MSRAYSLAHLTMLDLPPAELIGVAAGAGYDYVGLRLAPATPAGVAYALAKDARALAATLARLRDTGVRVFDLEIVRLDAGFQASAFLPLFDVGARLGAKAILVAGDDPDESRLTASFAALCEAAAPFGLAADLEFMPWTKVPDARTALRIATAAAQPNGGVLVDALHFARSASSHADVTAISRHMLHYAQICDAPAAVPTTQEGLIHTARSERLLPGEGGIDLGALFARLPRDLPISVEIPNDTRLTALGAGEWARQTLEASKASLAGMDA